MDEMSIGKGRRPAYFTRFVRIHVGVGQRGRAHEIESSAMLPATNTHVTFQQGNGVRSMQGQKASTHIPQC